MRNYSQKPNSVRMREWRLANPDKVKAAKIRWRSKQLPKPLRPTPYGIRPSQDLKAYRRAWHFKAEYGLTLEQFDQMITEQGNKCALCTNSLANEKGGGHVDHCHATGKVRAILCGKCNRGLGMFDESLDRLKLAVSYLERHQENN